MSRPPSPIEELITLLDAVWLHETTPTEGRVALLEYIAKTISSVEADSYLSEDAQDVIKLTRERFGIER